MGPSSPKNTESPSSLPISWIEGVVSSKSVEKLIKRRRERKGEGLTENGEVQFQKREIIGEVREEGFLVFGVVALHGEELEHRC